MHHLRFAATFAVLALAAPAHAQSFDCAKATTADEKAVCASPRLSALDSEMGTLYDEIRRCALMGTRGEVTDSQRAFMAKRAACGSDDSCLVSLYSARVAELGKIKRDMGQGAC